MRMHVDEAGSHGQSRNVDNLCRAFGNVAADFGDTAILDADVAVIPWIVCAVHNFAMSQDIIVHLVPLLSEPWVSVMSRGLAVVRFNAGKNCQKDTQRDCYINGQERTLYANTTDD